MPLGDRVYIPKFETMGHHMVHASLLSRTGSTIARDDVLVNLELDDNGDDEPVLVSPPLYPEFYTSQVPDQDYKVFFLESFFVLFKNVFAVHGNVRFQDKRHIR